jgi:hypothetical protein
MSIPGAPSGWSNIGLVALVANFLVMVVVSAATKDPSPTAPVAAPLRIQQRSAA